jgi:hypothetical protein
MAIWSNDWSAGSQKEERIGAAPFYFAFFTAMTLAGAARMHLLGVGILLTGRPEKRNHEPL